MSEPHLKAIDIGVHNLFNIPMLPPCFVQRPAIILAIENALRDLGWCHLPQFDMIMFVKLKALKDLSLISLVVQQCYCV